MPPAVDRGAPLLFYKPKGENAETLALMRRIDGRVLKYPFYSTRRMALRVPRWGRVHIAVAGPAV